MTTGASTGSAVTPASPPSVKARQQAMWASGDFAVIGTTLQIVGELLCEELDLRAGERVLDVAAGNGNATLAAARRFATRDVHRLRAGAARAWTASRRGGRPRRHLRSRGRGGAALSRASFDVVVSTFGVMFAPDHGQAASELMRVCRPGGRIGLASWTPEGFLGDLFRLVARHVPPIPGVRSPLLWGTDAHIQELFGSAASIRHTRRNFAFRYRSPEHWVEVFRTFYGPVHKAFAALTQTARPRSRAS